MQLRFPQYTPANGMSYFWPYLVLPIGFGLMALRLLQNLIRQVRITGFRDSLIAVAMGVTLSAPIWGQWDIGIIAALAGTMFLCLLLGVPIAVALAFSAMAALYNSEFLNVSTMAPTSFAALDSFTIMAIFFFVAAGVFMGCGGISRQLVDLADLMVGRRIGGMAMATVITCMFFAAICGSGPATVAAIGAITIPAMVERGYDKRFAAALVAAAGSIGVMIPPSNPMVVYGVLAKASIGKLFMGGIIPRRPSRARCHGVQLLAEPQERMARHGGEDFPFPEDEGHMGSEVGSAGAGDYPRRYLRRLHDSHGSRRHQRHVRSACGHVRLQGH